jgi:hypothetical protein
MQFPLVAQIFTRVIKLVNLRADGIEQLRTLLVILIAFEMVPFEGPIVIDPVSDMSLLPVIVPKFCWNTPIICTPPLKIIDAAEFTNVAPDPITNELENMGDPPVMVDTPVPVNEIGEEKDVDAEIIKFPVPVVVIAFVTTDADENVSDPPCGTFIVPAPFTIPTTDPEMIVSAPEFTSFEVPSILNEFINVKFPEMVISPPWPLNEVRIEPEKNWFPFTTILPPKTAIPLVITVLDGPTTKVPSPDTVMLDPLISPEYW